MNTRNISRSVTFAVIACIAVHAASSHTLADDAKPSDAVPKVRNFVFTYAATVTGLAPGQTASVWVPLADDRDEDQAVEVIERQLPSPDASIGRETKYGNRMLFFTARAGDDGSLPLRVVYRVRRNEATERAASTNAQGADVATADASDEIYLAPDRLVPVGGKPATLLSGKQLPDDQAQLGRALYDLVDDHMQYRKDQPGWGRGDAGWACDSRFGNCTDFHSLFISLSRTQHVPAKFEMGFSIPEKRGAGDVKGYHCWAKFKPADRGWIPVDISEANKNPARRDYFFGHLCENRVHFTTGRDLTLVPQQKGEPVNFMVFPYVEVAGKAWPQEKVKMACTYRDVDAAAPAAAAGASERP